MILCDTNIFISAFNGRQDTIQELQNIGLHNVLISSITVMELYQGMGNKQELAQMKSKIKFYDSVPVNEDISNLAQNYIEAYSLSHDLKIPDALIAGTAVYHGLELFTYNIKDFRYIPNLKLYQPK